MWASRLRWVLVGGMLLGVEQARSLPAPLCISSSSAILDEGGVPLRGMDAAAEPHGLFWQAGDLIQVLQADGGLFPAHPDGTPHPSNRVVAVGRIGIGVAPTEAGRGQFGLALSARPAGKLAVRAFNAPTTAQATSYGDSQVFTIHDGDVFLAAIARTDQMLAPDADGDGLNDAAEPALGADPALRDTDGDGLADGAEIAAGTGVNDPGSFLAVYRLQVMGPDAVVTWPSVAGRSYQVEFAPAALGGSFAFLPVSARIVAAGTATSAVIPDGAAAGQGQYRVRLLEEGS